MAHNDPRETGLKLDVRYNEQGLIPAIVQDAENGQILMMAWMNDQALAATLRDRRATFYSRSRGKMWVKGESSGHVMEVLEALVDCDQDAIVLRCRAHGPACHVGYRTCFYRAAGKSMEDPLKLVEKMAFDPAKVYGSGT
ncbi:MAG: phosphoribosyl-AMP cyclohydrolase [Phycisphaeraceae bacterium]|nr:phosphoribosyl-AMP cyclohydrolase [Phycisphaeraceae bacterium]